jgi:hypothetical protein
MVSTAAARYQNLSINTSKLAGQCGKLKCCLNFELDTYLDALKDIPEKVDVLQTEIGNARLQKTDIFKKMMWFSYQNQEDWIPLKVSRVREIVAMNKRGEKPNNLKDEAVELKPSVAAEKILDYENVVGQDSLTRLDNNQRRNKNNRRNDKNQAQGNKSNRTKPVQNASEKPQNTNTPSGDSESKPQQRNSRNRNRNRNKGRNPSADKKNEN